MKRRIFINFLISFILILPALSQNDTIGLSDLTSAGSRGLFDSDELLEVTLEFDIRQFRRTKFENEQQNAIMIYSLNGRDTVTREIRLRARGQSRRYFCSFPPIRLNLRRFGPPEDIFSGFDRIKMVTHCNSPNSEYILREYLVYRMFNVFTDYSFRVRLLKVNYVSTGRRGRPFSSYAFLIEPEESLSERTKTNLITERVLSQRHIKQDIMDRVAIFNYMIGNYDYSVPRYQNLVLLFQHEMDQFNPWIVVPYDFDYTGMVNPPYAFPPDIIPIESIRERLYFGICRNEETFRDALYEFLEKKEELYEVINNFPYMRNSSKRYMTDYLDSFYQDFDGRNTIVNKLLNECRNY